MTNVPIDLPATQYRVLLLGDQLASLSGAAEFLTIKAYRVYRSPPGANIGELIASQGIDILVLDADPGFGNGIELAKGLRSAFPRLGIIIASSRRRTEDKIASYIGGADLHISQPISHDELGAAIEALARRLRPAIASAATGELTLNPRTRELAGATGKTTLSQRDVSLIQGLCLSQDNMIEFAQLARMAGLKLDEAGKASLEVQIVRLRKKIDAVSGKTPAGNIKSIRGIGYQLCLSIRILTCPDIPAAHRAHSHA